MLDAFCSVGADLFVLTWRTLQDEEIQFRKHWSAGYIRHNLWHLLADAERRHLNLIIRPTSPRGFFLQLDDLNPDALERVKPIALLTLATSPGKTQAWLFVEGEGDPDADRDFRRRVKKACAADLMASGAVRIAGQPQFQAEICPELSPGRHNSCGARVDDIARATAATWAGRRARYRPAAPCSLERAGQGRLARLQSCLAGAPANSDNIGPDRSRADFLWRKWSIERGWPADQVAARLLEVSSKAREARHGEPYALGTAQRGAAAVANPSTVDK